MSDLAIAATLSALVLLASVISVEIGIASAIIELLFGVIAGSVFHIHGAAWLTFIASFGGILLTFLAGTEVDIKLMKQQYKQSITIGTLSFLVPFVLIFWCVYGGLHWTLAASKIAGIALSTTSLAVVYAILIETGMASKQLGKAIMAATFVTDFLTATALSVLFAQFNVYTVLFIIASLLIIFFGPRFIKFFFRRYGNRVIEPETKLIFAIFFLLMFLSDIGKQQAILPVFILGLLLSGFFESHLRFNHKLRTIGYAIITPFFFIKGGLNVSLAAVWGSLGTVLLLLVIKLGGKFLGVYPVAALSMPKRGRAFFTLLMSTGLTFGTISSTFGLQYHYITHQQFSVLIAVVIISAVAPTFIAQRFFSPLSEEAEERLVAVGEEGHELPQGAHNA